jgi:para-nitrobenzyl esterase
MSRLLLLVLAGSAIASAAISGPVRIDTGLITGTSTGTEEVRVFKGIPYAAPPVGDLRWRAPQPAAKWDGVLKADQFGPVCMQGARGGSSPAPSEDCLSVNVWTAAKSASEKRPVIVWTYGGGFTGGSGAEPRYDGEALAKKGVVFVTYNYRLGVFGFFAHPELTKESGHNASGNYGMMDMAAVLHWVQRNISAFGGDPTKVTIDGESAGAFLVSAMVGSPEGKGLFKRAIAQSGAWMGTSISHMTTREQAEAAGVKVAQALGASSIADLRAKTADDLFKNARTQPGVIVDGWYIPEDLSITFAKGKENDVDILVGSNRDEGTFFTRPGAGSTAAQFNDRAKQRFGNLAGGYAKLYPSSTDAEAAAAQLATQRDEFGWHMRTWAQLQEKRGKDKAYLYYFTRVPPSPEGRPSRGATHTAELAYMFNNLLPGTPWTEVDRKLADTMSSYWANFAATGNPNGKGLPEWPAYSPKAEQAMVLGDTVSVGTGIEPAILTFYDSYYKTFLGGE